jgi:hypothetical protein
MGTLIQDSQPSEFASPTLPSAFGTDSRRSIANIEGLKFPVAAYDPITILFPARRDSDTRAAVDSASASDRRR